MIAVAAILAVTGATIGLGIYGVRLARTTSDLFVASRAITPWWNAAAISGEYLSAASFLGIAGLQMKLGSGASAPTRSPTSPRRGYARPASGCWRPWWCC